MPKPTTFEGGKARRKAKVDQTVAADPLPFWSKLAEDTPHPKGHSPANSNSGRSEFAKPTFTLNFPGSEEEAERYRKALAALADIGFTNLSKDDLGKLNPVDEYERELKMMASVRGYFQVSYKVGVCYLSVTCIDGPACRGLSIMCPP
jgi:hypothetical protein